MTSAPKTHDAPQSDSFDAGPVSGPVPQGFHLRHPPSEAGDQEGPCQGLWQPPAVVDLDSYGIGATIGGKYRLEWRLGLGGMGIVWAARHVELDELVAIKAIRPDVHQDDETVQRFAREAKACARLRSEHIVRAFDVGIDAVFGPFIVMEYLAGEDLAQVLRNAGPVSIAEACDYALQACEALAVSHSHGIVHRDLKPSNLFLTRRGELKTIKILDFGTSKASLTGQLFGGDLSCAEATSFVGTPTYMSPEQIRVDADVDHRSDIWALGCILHELITGEPAFAAESLQHVCFQVLENRSPRLSVERSEPVLSCIQAVIDRCLEKAPRDRYANVAELAHDLVPLSTAEAQVHSYRASSLLKSGMLTPRNDITVAPTPTDNPTLMDPSRPVDEPSNGDSGQPGQTNGARSRAMMALGLGGAVAVLIFVYVQSTSRNEAPPVVDAASTPREEATVSSTPGESREHDRSSLVQNGSRLELALKTEQGSWVRKFWKLHESKKDQWFGMTRDESQCLVSNSKDTPAPQVTLERLNPLDTSGSRSGDRAFDATELSKPRQTGERATPQKLLAKPKLPSEAALRGGVTRLADETTTRRLQ